MSPGPKAGSPTSDRKNTEEQPRCQLIALASNLPYGVNWGLAHLDGVHFLSAQPRMFLLKSKRMAAFRSETTPAQRMRLSHRTRHHMAVCQNSVPLVNIKIGGKWMFVHPKMAQVMQPYEAGTSLLPSVWPRLSPGAAPWWHDAGVSCFFLAKCPSRKAPRTKTLGWRRRFFAAPNDFGNSGRGKPRGEGTEKVKTST